MRERLLIAFGTLILVIVAIYGIPRAYLLAEDVRTAETSRLGHSVDLLAELIPERERSEAVSNEYLGTLVDEGELIEYLDAQGELIATAGAELSGDENDVVASRELPDGGEIRLSLSGAYVEERITEAITPVVVIGVLVTIGAGVVCLVVARRLSRPFLDLAGTARQLGAGQFDIKDQQYRLPEAQAISAALIKSARQLEQLVEREREFAANASHQLRTPITALRLELEDLTYWPETTPEVAQELNRALGELDRLSTAVTQLLDLARGQRVGESTTVSVDEVLRDHASRWSRHASERRREIQVHSPGDLTGEVYEGPVAQIFDVLIENALTHGRGTVLLSAEDAGSHLRLSVQDEGTRPESQDIFERRVTRGSGEGIGLAVADELASAIGGSLTLDSTPFTRFLLILPQREDFDPSQTQASAQQE